MLNFFKSSKIFKSLCLITVVINHGNDVVRLCRTQPDPHIERRTQHQFRLSPKDETLLEEHLAHSVLKKGGISTNLSEIRKARRENFTRLTASIGLQMQNQRRQALDIHSVLYVGFVCVVSFRVVERHHANKTNVKNAVDI